LERSARAGNGIQTTPSCADAFRKDVNRYYQATIATGVSADPIAASRWSVLFCVIETFFSNFREAIGLSVFFNQATQEGDYRQSHHK
jgi:hypothetical protein